MSTSHARRSIRCGECGTYAPNAGRGLCHACYSRGRRAAAATPPGPRRPSVPHPAPRPGLACCLACKRKVAPGQPCAFCHPDTSDQHASAEDLHWAAWAGAVV